MVKNNIEVDVKVKCIEQETTQAQLAEDIGTTGQYVNRIIKKKDVAPVLSYDKALEKEAMESLQTIKIGPV